MKKIIVFLCLILPSFFSIAEESYYYCGSKKIQISKDPSHAIIFTPKSSLQNLREVQTIKIIRHLYDENYDLTVIHQNESIKFSDIMKMLPEGASETFIVPCYKDEYDKLMIPTGLVYVELKSESDYQKLEQAAEEHSCIILHQIESMPLWYTLQTTLESDGDCVEVANMMYESGMFANAEPSFAFEAAISYDPLVSDQWGLLNDQYDDIDISISEAWNYSTGKGIIVAVIDNGIDVTHDDLSSNISSKSYDAYTKTSPAKLYTIKGQNGQDITDHGTHCAGIIGAERNNNIYIAGVAPDVELMPISINLESSNSSEQIAEGINWAYKNGADIVSCSLSKRNPCTLVQTAIDNAIANGREKRGCVLVCASGNDSSTVGFPANYRKEIIAVGNIQKNGTIYASSNYGEELTVCAPGTAILSTIVNNKTGKMTGTSMACPHAAGVVALILQINPRLSLDKIRGIISINTKKKDNMGCNTSKEFGTWNEKYGYGLLDAYHCVLNTPR